MKPIKIAGMELATPGDVATFGISYALGAGVDAFFFSGGLTSLETGGAFAAGALGTKYLIQGVFKKNKKAPEDDKPNKSN